MSRQNPGGFPLFDLLARRWRLPAPATSALFDVASQTLAAPLTDGSIALIGVADAEPPEARIAVDEAGRRTITPRRGEPRAAILLAAEGGPPKLAASGAGFVVSREGGGLALLATDGTLTLLPAARDVVGLDATPSGRLALAGPRGVELRERDGKSRTLDEASAQAVAFSPDGANLAFGAGDALCVEISGQVSRYVCAGPVERVVWRSDGAFLVALCGAGGIALLDVEAGRFAALGGFPTPPRSTGFSEAANVLVVAGAYRIAAWDLGRPPFDGVRSGALETGRPGFVPVVEVAALPGRKLAAAAYANGQIVVAALGLRDEMILKASGPEPAALVASPDGRSLALASGDEIALIALPEALFK